MDWGNTVPRCELGCAALLALPNHLAVFVRRAVLEWRDALRRCDLMCAALGTRSAKSSCIVCSACSVGVGRHPTTARVGVCSQSSVANCGSSADVSGWPVGPTLCSAACCTSRRATRGPKAMVVGTKDCGFDSCKGHAVPITRNATPDHAGLLASARRRCCHAMSIAGRFRESR